MYLQNYYVFITSFFDNTPECDFGQINFKASLSSHQCTKELTKKNYDTKLCSTLNYRAAHSRQEVKRPWRNVSKGTKDNA